MSPFLLTRIFCRRIGYFFQPRGSIADGRNGRQASITALGCASRFWIKLFGEAEVRDFVVKKVYAKGD
jgi:hypothetical protein